MELQPLPIEQPKARFVDCLVIDDNSKNKSKKRKRDVIECLQDTPAPYHESLPLRRYSDDGKLLGTYRTYSIAASLTEFNAFDIRECFLGEVPYLVDKFGRPNIWRGTIKDITIRPIPVSDEHYITRDARIYSLLLRDYVETCDDMESRPYIRLNNTRHYLDYLVITAFMQPLPYNYKFLSVKHKNGINKDCNIENLCFEVPKSKRKVNKIYALDWNSLEIIYTFPNAKEAALFFGTTSNTIYHYCNEYTACCGFMLIYGIKE